MRPFLPLAAATALVILSSACGPGGLAAGGPGRSTSASQKPIPVTLTFEVDGATTYWGQSVYVVGDAAELGAWDPARAVPLSPTAYPNWSAGVALPQGQAVQFKFIKRDSASGAVVWESGANRQLVVPSLASGRYWGAWDQTAQGGVSGAQGSNTELGMPDTLSTTDVANLSHYLSVKPQYVVSYDANRKTPNWVSWSLSAADLGTAGRANDFRPDDTLPSSIPQASPADYSSSGYDRGHMCPSGDRTATVADNENTFYLTNMVPQAHNNNAGPWEKLETYLRSLAQGGKQLYIVSGGVFPDKGPTVGAGVAVPSSTWKVAAVLDAPGVQSVTTSTRVIAVIMPNDDSQITLTDDWHNYRVTTRAVEQATGLNMFSSVPQAIQDVIETQVDTQP